MERLTAEPVILDAGEMPECPRWDEASGQLLWVDIYAGRLHTSPRPLRRLTHYPLGGSMPRRAFRSNNAPPPAGPYSQSVRVDNIVVGAGQAGIRPDGSIVDGVRAQTSQAFSNLLAAMGEAGATADDIVSVRVFLRLPEQFAEMNDAYAEIFAEPYPARTTVYVGLPDGLEVEVDALAVIPRTDSAQSSAAG